MRDLLLHRHHEDPWRGLPDLDLVVEGRAAELVQRLPEALEREFGCSIPLSVQEHGAFGTFELELDLPAECGGTWLLDVASARQETYPVPAENPIVSLGSLRDDLARRDFTVNAMALELSTGELLDLHQGQRDLAARRLNLLHSQSLRDDPTRLVRGARYAARLGFHLSEEAQQQVVTTLKQWPWHWRPGDDPGQAPPALGTRLRMELELLFKREPWREALEVLQSSEGFLLLDSQLQGDRGWPRRLRRAKWFSLPLLVAFVVISSDPISLAQRLQLPKRYQKTILQTIQLEKRLHVLRASQALESKSPSWWTQFLESPGIKPETVALAISMGIPEWRPLFKWWARWRKVQSPLGGLEVMNKYGLTPGIKVGEKIYSLRLEKINQMFK